MRDRAVYDASEVEELDELLKRSLYYLRDMQWIGDKGYRYCRYCENDDYRHKSDCSINKLIKDIEVKMENLK